MDEPTAPPVLAWSAAARPRETFLPALDAGTAARIVVAALGIGALAQLLLVGEALGINALILVVALLGAARLIRRPGAVLDRADGWLPPAALAFGVLLAVRSAPSLVAFDLVAVIALSGASVAALLGHAVTRRAASTIAMLGALLAVGAAVGATALGPGFAMVRGRLARRRTSAMGPVVRGLLIALPVVVLFGALFAAADAVFQKVIGDALRFDLDLTEAMVRLVVVAGVAWLTAGVFASSVEARPLESAGPVTASAVDTRERLRLGAVEASIVVIAVDLVFAMFVALQAAYLFGGRDTLALTGLSYSEYARRGFLELIGASFLAGLLVLGCDALIVRRSRAFTAGAIVLAILAGVVLLSAGVRLGLYQQAYGWTELRFYALAAIAWIGVSLAAAAYLLARRQARWLPHAAAILAFAVAIAVNVADPQAFVAAQNVDRAEHPERIAPGGRSGLDAEYLAMLGDDAVPTLVEALPTLPAREAALLRRALHDRRAGLALDRAGNGWPSSNLSRQRAIDALATLPD